MLTASATMARLVARSMGSRMPCVTRSLRPMVFLSLVPDPRGESPREMASLTGVKVPGDRAVRPRRWSLLILPCRTLDRYPKYLLLHVSVTSHHTYCVSTSD